MCKVQGGHTQPVGGNSQIQWESDQQACIVLESASSKKDSASSKMV
jgi:hypothetical protein